MFQLLQYLVTFLIQNGAMRSNGTSKDVHNHAINVCNYAIDVRNQAIDACSHAIDVHIHAIDVCNHGNHSIDVHNLV